MKTDDHTKAAVKPIPAASPTPGVSGRDYRRCVRGHPAHPVALGAACLHCMRDWTDDRENLPKPLRPSHTWLADHPAYATMVGEAERRKWPKHFGTDLTDWDRWSLAIQEDPRRPFLWTLRASGTHLAWVEEWVKTGPSCWPTVTTYIQKTTETFGGECFWYGWDGSELHKFEHTKAAVEWAEAIVQAAREKVS
jgi:hypothetical protein